MTAYSDLVTAASTADTSLATAMTDLADVLAKMAVYNGTIDAAHKESATRIVRAAIAAACGDTLSKMTVARALRLSTTNSENAQHLADVFP